MVNSEGSYKKKAGGGSEMGGGREGRCRGNLEITRESEIPDNAELGTRGGKNKGKGWGGGGG